MSLATQVNVRQQLEELLAQRILILDGAMGTMIFSLGIDEVTMRGERFANHHKDLKLSLIHI